MSVEDLVQRVIWGKAFVDNAQKFLAKVCFYLHNLTDTPSAYLQMESLDIFVNLKISR